MSDAHNVRRSWSIITALLVLAVFIEAVFAGAMLSGVDWARTAHSVNASILLVSTLTAGLISLVALRHVPNGVRLGLTLSSLAVLVVLQTLAGVFSAKGVNLLWVHVPLGVALFGLAAQAARTARRLCTE
jgi:hypothetical protein